MAGALSRVVAVAIEAANTDLLATSDLAKIENGPEFGRHCWRPLGLFRAALLFRVTLRVTQSTELNRCSERRCPRDSCDSVSGGSLGPSSIARRLAFVTLPAHAVNDGVDPVARVGSLQATTGQTVLWLRGGDARKKGP